MANEPQENMMRIAIAGSGGLARIFAHYLNATVHPFIILSRQAQPDLEALDYQIAVVNYDSQDELRYTLRGIDLVISTVSGNPQINLIDAAAHSDVRRFVPAEFEGPPGRRPRNDPLDRGRAATLDRLRHWSHHHRHRMASTIFICGVFYERFARGGLGSLGIGTSTNVYYQGSYLMDVEASTAEIVERQSGGQAVPIFLCLTSVYDVVQFLVAALDIPLQNWPAEFKMRGDRRSVAEVVLYAESVKGGAPFVQEVIQARDLPAHLEHATYYQDFAKVGRVQELIATEQRRYDYTTANLNTLVNVVPTNFWDWLREHWGAQ
ncbi:isoflavone reductase family protein-like protein [Hyaloscypha bicolor E]|uniref:Isoflavone reductase family protein-like protein n=1 Tax=Hyaloscypha bicolor E TaxID=1095630 RepID=A0A2J6TS55_9HELO|nr:isoflavone reductase family protein-like protein [Hyaloscypha bicolor E]PMD65851.1 isoflavone reductase family protein-like protein [Hyaloscypha bicolor E]